MIKACIFDAFGTLFNLDQSLLDDIDHPDVSHILAYAREKQLSYTWLKSLMNDYQNFEKITQTALRDACRKYNAPSELIEQLSTIYFKPIVFEDVLATVKSLKEINIKTGILSNGTHAMLNSGIKINSLESHIDAVYSADDIRMFKPHPSVYQMVCAGENCKPQHILFISSNQWDIAGAHKFGFNTVWLNRKQLFRESIISADHIREINHGSEIPVIIENINSSS